MLISSNFYKTILSLNLNEFLPWLKQKTELEWTDYSMPTLEDYQRRGINGGS